MDRGAVVGGGWAVRRSSVTGVVSRGKGGGGWLVVSCLFDWWLFIRKRSVTGVVCLGGDRFIYLVGGSFCLSS